MDFWDNILRYPRFFISSLLGLVLVLLAPFIQFSKELQNKKLFFGGLFFIFLFLILTLNLMLYSNS
jgi:hypothetical protein